MKPATRKALFGRDGKMKKNFIQALNSCTWDAKRRRVYPCRYSDEFGNPANVIDLRLYVLGILKRERLRFTQGIDKERAPRGGIVGTYYTLTVKGWETLNKIKEWQD